MARAESSRTKRGRSSLSGPGTESDTPELVSGAESILRTLTAVHDHTVVFSETERRGIALPAPPAGRVHRAKDPAGALSFASGLAATGQTVGVFVDAARFTGVRELIESAAARQLPITVVLSQTLTASDDPTGGGTHGVLRSAIGSSAPVLSASSAQELVDYISIARAVTAWAPMPVVVFASGRSTVWALQECKPVGAVADIVSVPDSIRTYRRTLLGNDDGGNPAWLNTTEPVELGAPLPDTLALKRRLGRFAFLENGLKELLSGAFESFSEMSGRPCSWGDVSGSAPADVILVATGAMAARAQTALQMPDGAGPRVAVVNVRQLHPFPTPEIAGVLKSASRIGVLGATHGSGEDVAGLVKQVRQALLPGRFDDVPEKKGRRRPRRHAEDAPVVLSVACPDAWQPTAPDLRAIAERLLEATAPASFVVGVEASAADVRLPEVERMRQSLSGQGVDLKQYEIPATAVRRSHGVGLVQIVTGSGRETWRLLASVSRLLTAAGAKLVHASFDPSSDATTHPVLGNVTWRDPSAESPIVLVRNSQLFGTLPVREFVLEASSVLVVDAPNAIPVEPEMARLPSWMMDRGLSVRFVDANAIDLPAVPEEAHADWALLAALMTNHPYLVDCDPEMITRAAASGTTAPGDADAYLKKVEQNTRTASPDDFEPSAGRPPEPEVPREVAASPADRLPVADLSRFWKTTGILYRQGRLTDLPADPFLASGVLPARSGSLTQQLVGLKPLPNLIPERCTGCGACWTMCPESAFTSTLYALDSLVDTAMAASKKAGKTFLHLPRLAPAIVKTMQKTAASDDLHRLSTAADLLLEASTTVLDKAGLESDKRAAVEEELQWVSGEIGLLRPVRTELYFDRSEKSEKGSGRFLGLTIDPFACTTCGLCIASCNDRALERASTPTASKAVQAEWHQLMELDLPSPSVPDTVLDSPNRETAPLTMIGRSTDRVFRAGGADVGNTNRTALRLFLEAGQSAAGRRHSALLRRVETVISRIDERLQDEVSTAVSVNDFEAFTRSLRSFKGAIDQSALAELARASSSVESKRPDDASELIGELAELRARCDDRRIRLRSLDAETTRAHMILVKAMSHRSFGLAGYPINPFGMPCITAGDEAPGSLLSGIYEGLRQTISDLVRLLETAEKKLDGVFDPAESSSESVRAHDRAVEAAMPLVLLVTDRIDQDVLAAVANRSSVKVLVVSDGYASFDRISGPSVPIAPALALPDVFVLQTALRDPVLVLEELLEAACYEGPALVHLYAPDPVRDGLAPEDALALARAATTSRVFPSVRRIPGSSIDLSSNPRTDPTAPALWMLAQRRFAGHFTFVPRKDWSAENVSLEQWTARSSEEKADACAFVEQPRHDGTISRYLLDESVLGFTEAVTSAWNALQRSASRREPAREDRVATEPPEGAPVASQPEPEPDGPTDAFATLSDRLFSLSGFRDANLTLAEWPPPSDSNGTEGSEST